MTHSMRRDPSHLLFNHDDVEGEEQYEDLPVKGCFRWEDPELRKLFATFGGYQRSALSAAFVALLFTYSFIMNIASAVTNRAQIEEMNELFRILSIIEIIFSFVAFVGSWIIFFYQAFPQSSKASPSENPTLLSKEQQHYLQCTILIASTMARGLRLIIRVEGGSCDQHHHDLSAIEMYCNPNSTSHSLPPDTAFLLMIAPVLFVTVMRETSFEALICSWSLSVIFLGIATAMLGHIGCLTYTIPMTVTSLLIIVDTLKHNINIFFMNRKLQELVVENEQLSKEEHKNEIRNLIANVAHDLKTVSTTHIEIRLLVSRY